jgi:DNA polymerase III delta prime subunit
VDKLSKEAQHSLRRTMEKYSAACRLVLCCNSASKVIEAVRSRCLPVRVNLPSHEEVSIDQERKLLLTSLSINQERQLLITFQKSEATITISRYCAARRLVLCCDGACRVIKAVEIRYFLNRVPKSRRGG